VARARVHQPEHEHGHADGRTCDGGRWDRGKDLRLHFELGRLVRAEVLQPDGHPGRCAWMRALLAAGTAELSSWMEPERSMMSVLSSPQGHESLRLVPYRRFRRETSFQVSSGWLTDFSLMAPTLRSVAKRARTVAALG
jgi:hypothetical protein